MKSFILWMYTTLYISRTCEWSLGVLSLTQQKHLPASLTHQRFICTPFGVVMVDAAASEASRCAPGISQTLVRFVVALWRPAEKKDAFPMQCVVAAFICCKRQCWDQSWAEQWPEEASFILMTGMNKEMNALSVSVRRCLITRYVRDFEGSGWRYNLLPQCKTNR